MNATTRNGSKVVVLDGTWQYPPPGVVCRMAYVLLSKESDVISAVVLNLPGCASQGGTIEEAMANVREALEGCLVAYAESGQPTPWKSMRDCGFARRPPFTELRSLEVQEKGDGKSIFAT